MANHALPEYIYSHLDRFGNTIISRKIMNSLGEKRIINILKKRGYSVDIIAKEDLVEEYNPKTEKRAAKYQKNMTFILQLK